MSHMTRQELQTRRGKLLRRIANVATLGILATLVSFQANAAIRDPIDKTKLVIAVRDPSATYDFPDITPDGRYIQVTDPQTNESWLVGMDGHRYHIPTSKVYIYDSTPNGDVVFRYPAGTAPLAFVFRPGSGIVRKFPGKDDQFAAATHYASQSVRGQWVECMSNVPGGDPLKEIWYDIDDKTVPLLQHAVQVSWAPSGNDLAALIGGATDPSLWLVIYHTKSHERETCGSYPIPLPDPMAPQAVAPRWSLDGQYIGVLSNKGLVIFNTEDKRLSSFDVNASASNWGWASNGRIYVLSTADHGTTVQYYELKNGAWTPTDQVKLSMTVRRSRALADGRILVKGTLGAISVIDGSRVAPLVKSGADRWWYDVGNGYVYYGVRKTPSDKTEPVFRVKLS